MEGIPKQSLVVILAHDRIDVRGLGVILVGLLGTLKAHRVPVRQERLGEYRFLGFNSVLDIRANVVAAALHLVAQGLH